MDNITAKDLNDLSVKERINFLKQEATIIWGKDTIRRDLAVGQAILESAIRRDEISGLAKKNNLFGIKGSGTKGFVTMQTREEDHNGVSYHTNAEFASNNTLRDSFEQHRKLLYKPRYGAVLLAITIEGACKQIVNCGYATDKLYTQKLLDVINEMGE